MRLTNSTLLRGYNRDLSRLRTEKNAVEKKITSTRNFSRASEAPLSAAKALNVRKSQYYSAQYKENLGVAAKFYTEAETSLLQVSEKMAEIRETIIAAVNTTKDSVDYKIYSQQLETRAEELCAIFNTDSAGRSIFGGESDNGMPFNIINDSDGRPSTVLYHNVPVNAMNDYNGFPYSTKVNMDIGLGMATDQQEHTQDPMSVLDISFNGMKITGCGSDYGVADIDLSAIQQNRNYVFDIYADGRKQTITFRAKGTQAENVTEINKLLSEAYEKDKNYGLPYPEMDDQGMIRLKDAHTGKALDSGVVSVVNNVSCTSTTRAEKLVIDNDSNYTSKFKLITSELKPDMKYFVDVEVGSERKTISFMSGEDEDEAIANFQASLDEVFTTERNKVHVSAEAPNKGVVSSEGNTVKLYKSSGKADNPDNYPEIKNDTAIDPAGFENGKSYSFNITVGGETKKITVTGGAGAADTVTNIQKALDDAFGAGKAIVDQNGEITAADGSEIKAGYYVEDVVDVAYERERIYSNNYIQLTLDAARALRNNDIEYANGCIDRIVTASEKLLAEIANLGCNEDFIDFNKERLTIREENLAERQNDLETVDPEYQITLWKQYEAYYNACLQMSSSVIPNSIFNYMK